MNLRNVNDFQKKGKFRKMFNNLKIVHKIEKRKSNEKVKK